MKSKTVNIIGIIIIVLETLLQSIGVFNLPPDILKWTIVVLAVLAFVLNGIKIHFPANNPVVWFNYGAYLLYLAGGVSDLFNIIPLSDSVESNILKIAGVVYAILNIVLRKLYPIDDDKSNLLYK